ncbi:MAG TPA: hypothetical protein VGM82_19690 [Gemmatimonadaceae bacterium]
MTSSPIDSRLLAILPTDAVGAIAAITPIQVGLSGAGVWAATTARAMRAAFPATRGDVRLAAATRS